MMANHVLSWAVNVVTVVVLPARLGLLGAPPSFFIAYAVIAGTVLMLAEDPRYARSIFARADIRRYLAVRIAIVVVVGIAPYFTGRMLA
jgi:hypothetical protein